MDVHNDTGASIYPNYIYLADFKKNGPTNLSFICKLNWKLFSRDKLIIREIIFYFCLTSEYVIEINQLFSWFS